MVVLTSLHFGSITSCPVDNKANRYDTAKDL